MALTTVQNGMIGTVNSLTDSGGNVFGGLYGFKNRIINGAMAISQRNTSFTNLGSGSYTTANGYCLDRWFGFRGGYTSNEDASQQTGWGAYQYALRMQRTSGTSSTQYICMNQVIETANCYDLAGQQVTLSVSMRAGANYSGGAVSLAIQSSSTVNDTSVNVTNGLFTLGTISTTVSITTTATTYTLTGTIPAGAKTLALQIGYTPSGTAGAADYIEFTGVQIELGSTATSFDYRPYGTELALCQRYYQVGDIHLFSGNTSSGDGTVSLPVQMRANPSYTYTDSSGTANTYTDSGGSGQTLSINANSVNTYRFRAQVILARNATWWEFNFKLSAEL